MGEKKPEEKQIRRAPYPQPYPAYPPPPPPPPPQYRPPPHHHSNIHRFTNHLHQGR